ncbi:hypothetical protein ACN4EE_16290 [Geminocystis sp. CENA526]|uniref:hypothetical protein n=1 Tax=Geminocystis sp. CENA526 TaxID=1355871 RepID=UPI003D6F76F3
MNFILLLIGLFALFMSASAIVQAWHKFQYLYQYPEKLISRLKKGDRAKIRAKISPHSQLILSPITNTQCAVWHIGLYSKNTQPNLHKKFFQSQGIISIFDRTGTIKVDLEQVVIELLEHNYFNDYQYLLKPFKDERTKVFLEQYLGKIVIKNLSVVEKILLPQDKIIVWGKLEIIDKQKILVASKISDSVAYQISAVILFTFGGLFGVYLSLALIWYSIT